MIDLKQGDILKADAEALVNTVNCVGVMGRGIALQFKKAFPENFNAYKAICDKGALRPGKVFVHDLDRLVNPRYIFNVPTKRYWKGKSRIEDIESGLKALVHEVRALAFVHCAACWVAAWGLDWEEVRPRIERSRTCPTCRAAI